MKVDNTGRKFLRTSAIVGTGLVLSGCAGGNKAQPEQQANGQSSSKSDENQKGGEVTATEDLMREHGVLRRALLVYTAAAAKLRANASAIPPDALQKTAKLFRSFGEDYHEKKLEETYIFPAVKQAGGPAAGLPDIAVVQHNRGREITEYIIAVTQGAKLGAANAVELAKALDAFVLMYQHHAAREDTIIFPAWKQTLTANSRTSKKSSSVQTAMRMRLSRSVTLKVVSEYPISLSSRPRLRRRWLPHHRQQVSA